MKMKTTFSWLAALALAGAAMADVTHRYSFDADASDSVGTAHGTVEGLNTWVGGVVGLSGPPDNDSFVDLPSGLLQDSGGTPLEAVTLETWATIGSSDAVWTRLFDFGAYGGDPNVGRNYLGFIPHSGPGDTRLTISDADPGYNHEQMVILPGTLDDDTPHHIVGVIDPPNGWMAVYIDGVLQGYNTGITIPLSAVAPDESFLGRSLYAADGYLYGTIDEFRIHDGALTSPQVAASYFAGPDSLTANNPGTVVSLGLNLPGLVYEGATIASEPTATYSSAGTVVLGPNEATITSADSDIVEVLPDGRLAARSAGTVELTIEHAGQQGTASVTVQANPATIAHRYSFTNSAVDSVGGANGTLVSSPDGTLNVTFENGQAVFPGGPWETVAYIDLPDGIVSSKQNITIEVWTTWNGPAGSYWQRVFDFGNGGKGESAHNPGDGTGGFFLTPLGGAGDPDGVQCNMSGTGWLGERFLTGPETLPIGQQVHVVALCAPVLDKSQLWIDGRLIDSDTAPFLLSDLIDANNWLGASNWNDAAFNGLINELRIYEGALSELEIALAQEAGPDTLPPSPGALQSIALDVPPLLLGKTTATYASLLADYENIQDVNVSALFSSGFTSSDTGVFTVDNTGAMMPVSAGTADLTATYEGLEVTVSVEVLAPTELSLTYPSPLDAGGLTENAELIATYPGDLTANVAAFAGVTFESSKPGVANVNAVGALQPRGIGSATVTGTYGGLSADASVQVELPEGYAQPTLLHRYSFSEAPGSTVVEDSVGDADGELVNPTATSDFTGTGRLALGGGAYNGTEGYVNLPNAMFSVLPSFTFEGWVNWGGPAGESWQRIFDVGRTSAVDGSGNPVEDTYANPGVGYMFLTPRSGDNTFRFAIKEGTGAEIPQLNTAPLPVGQDTHFAVVYDTASGAARLYVNGQRTSTGVIVHPLTVLEDINVYLGRSNWTDPLYAGEFDEFRIWSGALLDAEVLAGFQAGPDELPDLTPPPTITVALDGGNVVISWPATAQGFDLQTSAQLGPQAGWTSTGATPVEVDGRLEATLPVSSGEAFLRLKKD